MSDRDLGSPCRTSYSAPWRPLSDSSPITISTAAPTSLIAVKASVDAATTAAIPAAANTPQVSTPIELPAVVKNAARRPPREALRTTSAVVAPGVIVSSAATGANVSSVLSTIVSVQSKHTAQRPN